MGTSLQAVTPDHSNMLMVVSAMGFGFGLLSLVVSLQLLSWASKLRREVSRLSGRVAFHSAQLERLAEVQSGTSKGASDELS